MPKAKSYKRVAAMSLVMIFIATSAIIATLYLQHARSQPASAPTPRPRLASNSEFIAIVTSTANFYATHGIPPPPPEDRPKDFRLKTAVALNPESINLPSSQTNPPPRLTEDDCRNLQSADDIPLLLCRELILANQKKLPLPDLSIPSIVLVQRTTFISEINNSLDYSHFYNLFPTVSGYLEVSVPVLSENRNDALIYVNFSCGGLCAHGAVLHLKKSAAGWKIVKFGETYVS